MITIYARSTASEKRQKHKNKTLTRNHHALICENFTFQISKKLPSWHCDKIWENVLALFKLTCPYGQSFENFLVSLEYFTRTFCELGGVDFQLEIEKRVQFCTFILVHTFEIKPYLLLLTVDHLQ